MFRWPLLTENRCGTIAKSRSTLCSLPENLAGRSVPALWLSGYPARIRGVPISVLGLLVLLGAALVTGLCPARPVPVSPGGVWTLGAVAAPAAAPHCRTTPPAPDPVAPSNGDTVLTTTPTMIVESSVVVDSYHFRVMEEQSIAAQGYSLEPRWDPGKSGLSLQRGHRYHWSCRVRDATGWSPWFTPHWEFVVGYNIPAPEPKVPEDGAMLHTLRPVLVVKPVNGPVRYHFVVWDGKTMVGEGVTTTPSWLYDGQRLRLGNRYQWTCRIETPEDTSDWFRPEWSFELVRAPVEDGVVESSETRLVSVQATPSPFSEKVIFSARTSRLSWPVVLQIFSTDGRMVRSMVAGSRPARNDLFVWDGRDQENRMVCPGTYFCRIMTESGQSVLKLMKVN
ncbi:MAG: hypothetical protein ABIL25_05265 [candidate division WOR-3 bacterium]